MYSCVGEAVFSSDITPVFSVTWSFRNHSNMLIWFSTITIIINVETDVLLDFVGTMTHCIQDSFGE